MPTKSIKFPARAMGSLFLYLALAGVMVFTLLPFAWLIDSSFKDPLTLFRGAPTWAIEKFSFSGYEWILNPDRGNILVPLWNSIFVSVCSVVLAMVLAVLAGYAVGRFRFSGLPLFLGLLFLAQIFQGPVIMIPWYKMAAAMKLLDTPLILVFLYGTITIPVATLMMSGFFKAVPQELEEAASMDGLGDFGTLTRIVLPLCVPGIVAVSILTFIFAWNDYQYALILTSSFKSKTVQILINDLVQAVGAINWTGLLAAGVIATLPVVVLFGFVQKYMVAGLTAGAVKG